MSISSAFDLKIQVLQHHRCLSERAKISLSPVVLVVGLLPTLVLRAPAVLDVPRHGLLALLCGLHRVIGALVVFLLADQNPLKVLRAIFDIVQPLRLGALCPGLAVATNEDRAPAIAIEVQNTSTSAVYMSKCTILYCYFSTYISTILKIRIAK